MENYLLAFDEMLLAAYESQPELYDVESDSFQGRLLSTEASINEGSNDSLLLKFGYRRLANGKKAIIVSNWEYEKLSDAHKKIFTAFKIEDQNWASEDEMYDRWYSSNIQSDWSIGNGSNANLIELMRKINAVAFCFVEKPLFKVVPTSLKFPIGENSYAYQDSHADVYRYLIDEIDKETIAAIATKLGRKITVDGKTLKALGKLFPALGKGSSFYNAIEKVSDARRLSSHKARPAAVTFPAHDTFERDILDCVAALDELRAILEEETHSDADFCSNREYQIKHFPTIDDTMTRPPYGVLEQAHKMEGKTIVKIEYGSAGFQPGVHQSEILILHFEDGSKLAIDTGSNAGNIHMDHPEISVEDFHTNFDFKWIDAF